MNGRPPVDQVMVRRVGGWTLLDVAAWRALPPAECVSLVQQKAVRFLAAGVLVEEGEALRSLDDGLAGLVTAPLLPVGTQVVTWPSPGVAPTSCQYVRLVVEGPRWEVFRRDPAGDVAPLAEVRGGWHPSAYDLQSPAGLSRLVRDLVGDCLGLRDVDEAVGGRALEYFARVTFPEHLGNRAWRTDGDRLRGLLTANPFLVIVPGGASQHAAPVDLR